MASNQQSVSVWQECVLMHGCRRPSGNAVMRGRLFACSAPLVNASKRDTGVTIPHCLPRSPFVTVRRVAETLPSHSQKQVKPLRWQVGKRHLAKRTNYSSKNPGTIFYSERQTRQGCSLIINVYTTLFGRKAASVRATTNMYHNAKWGIKKRQKKWKKQATKQRGGAKTQILGDKLHPLQVTLCTFWKKKTNGRD